jgi:hypothetical protein
LVGLQSKPALFVALSSGGVALAPEVKAPTNATDARKVRKVYVLR